MNDEITTARLAQLFDLARRGIIEKGSKRGAVAPSHRPKSTYFLPTTPPKTGQPMILAL